MATIKDIAKLVGVSVATVSYALNHKDKVSKETREKVLLAAKSLNYQKNGLASDLKRDRTQTIALMVTDLAGPHYAELVKGIQEVTLDKGYDLIACSTRGGDSSTAVKFLTEKRVDGAIVLAYNVSEEIIKQSARAEFPVVLMDRTIEHDFVINIEVDNESGAYAATEHLIRNGHKEIGFIGGSLIVSLHQDRQKGFLKALKHHGLSLPSRFNITSGHFTQENGYTSTKMLIAQGKLPSAIFYANDEMAIGGLKAFNEADIKVPQDISIVGFDDIELARYIKPGLTTVMQPKYERGALAAHLIFQYLEGEKLEKNYCMPTQLIVRESCGSK